MATSYDECYEVFLNKTDDNSILYPADGESNEDFEDRIHTLLIENFKSAIVKYFNPISSLNRDDTTEMFEYDLRPVEIEIIGLLMLKEYYRKQYNFLASLKIMFSDKDFKSHPKEASMNQYRQAMSDIDIEINNLMVKNTYRTEDGSLQGWWS